MRERRVEGRPLLYSMYVCIVRMKLREREKAKNKGRGK